MSGATVAPKPWDDYLKPMIATSIIGGIALAVLSKGEMNADLGKSVGILAGTNLVGSFVGYQLFPGTVIFDDARILPAVTGGVLYAGGEHFVHPGHMGKHLAIGLGANLVGDMVARDKTKANALNLSLKAQKAAKQ